MKRFPRGSVALLFITWLVATSMIPIPVSAAPAALEKVKISFPAIAIAFLPLFVGKSQGVYGGEGIDLDPVRLGGNPVMAALVNGELDYSSDNSQLMLGAVSGLPVKLLAYMSVKPSFSLVARPDIKAVQDLKGKAISVQARKTLTDYVAREMVRNYGLDPDKDITTLGVGDHSSRLAAVRGGSAAAALIDPPNDFVAETMGLKILAFASDSFKNLGQGGLGTTEARILKQPDQVRKMMRAFVKSLVYTREHRNEVVGVIESTWKVDKVIAGRTYDSVINNFSRDGTATDGVVQETTKMLKALRDDIKGDIPMDKLVDLSFLKEAQKELGISVK